MYADDTVIYVSQKSISEVEKAWTRYGKHCRMAKEQQAYHKFEKIEKRNTLGYCKKLHSINDFQIWMNEHLIHVVNSYKYLGVL